MLKDITINGIVIKVCETIIDEQRPTIIFLHESLGCIELWRDFPEALGRATNCNVLIYDRQGYGQSGPFTGEDRKSDYLELEADVLHLLIEQLGLKQVILFGHSDGGSIVLIAAAKHPNHIIGLISEATHIFVEEITKKGVQDAVVAYKTTRLKERLEKYHGDKTDAVFWAWAGTWLNEAYWDWSIEHFLPRIKCPVLVIQGENDNYGSEAQVDGVVDRVSGATTKLMIPATGHTPHREARQWVMEHCVTFVERLVANGKD